jgi:tetratricopeptide (TPR) repeat protein
MALLYIDWNMENEAMEMLDLAPGHPMVQLMQAWLLDRAGYGVLAVARLASAADASPDLVFPFRPEMISMLSWANQVVPDWKWAYYEGLICWHHNQLSLARAFFNSCGFEPDFAPFYLARARLFSDDPAVVRESVQEAYLLDPGSWRCATAMANLLAGDGQTSAAVEVAGDNYKSNPDNCVVALHYANILKKAGQYNRALEVLGKIRMLPAESDKWSGETDSHTLFRELNIIQAIGQMKSGKWNAALKYLGHAEKWPENLGWGEPYYADNRLTRFFSAYCQTRMGDREGYANSMKYISGYRNPDGPSAPLENQLASMMAGGSTDFRAVTESLIRDHGDNSEAELLKMFMKVL